MGRFTVGRVVLLVVVVVGLVIGVFSVGSMFEYLDASEVMVIQAPFSGNLAVYTQPGVYWQGYGAVTHYRKREQFSFSSSKTQGKAGVDESIKMRFNDGGHAQLSGVISWEMPVATDKVVRAHTLFGSQQAIEQQLVRPTIERAIYLTGPLMSSTESYAARRNELVRFIEDQLKDGIYRTEVAQERAKDVVSGQEKTVSVTRLVMVGGVVQRQGESPFKEFGIVILPLSINEVKYDETVEKQIAQQQAAIMQVQTAQAKAREAEQEKLTVESKGAANAAQAKWEQEVIKAKEVTAGEQRLRVAQLDAQAAEQKKRELTLLGEGEAARRRLVMEADGALDKKLAAYVEVHSWWADAFKGFQGKVVPDVVMGGDGAGKSNAALDFLSIMGTRAARDLALDLSASGATRTKSGK